MHLGRRSRFWEINLEKDWEEAAKAQPEKVNDTYEMFDARWCRRKVICRREGEVVRWAIKSLDAINHKALRGFC